MPEYVARRLEAALVERGTTIRGARVLVVGLAYRCVPDDELADAAHEFARGAASAPRELAILTKQTIRDMAEIATHPDAVAREFEPQLWTVQQPWFEERVAALKAKISRKDG